jgi:4-carboxymuconolactone decarboxylase
MARYPPIPPSSFSPEQQKAHEELSDFCTKALGENGKVFIWKDENDSVIALGPSLYTASIIHPLLMFLAALGKLPGLPAEAREVAILATGSIYQAAYELYSHVRRATATTNLTAPQIEAVKNGTKPSREDALDEQCEVAFDVAIELANKRGPMSEVTWKRAEQAFTREGAAALIQYCALYAYTCVVLNAADVPVPEGEKY